MDFQKKDLLTCSSTIVFKNSKTLNSVSRLKGGMKIGIEFCPGKEKPT
jgi:hypothetical protein